MTTSTIRAAESGKVRLLGSFVAGTISLSLVAVPNGHVQLGSLTIDLRGLGLVGAPLAAVMALWLTPAAARTSWRGAAGIGIAMGAATAYVGVLELALLTLIASLLGLDPATGFSDDLFGSLFIAVIGLPFGTFVLPITIPCGLVWALVIRTLARVHRHEQGPAALGS